MTKNKSLLKKVVTNLTFWVLIAVMVGVLLGHFYPAEAVKMEIVGKTFVDIIKLFIGPIIFLTIVLGIAGMESLGKVGRIGLKAILYFEVVTTVALIIGIVVANIIQPGKINKTGLLIQDASKYTAKSAAGIDWYKFFLSNFTLQVLVVAIITGIIIGSLKRNAKAIIFLRRVSHYVFLALKYVMYLAPLGAFGGMAYTVGKFGLHTLIPLAKLMLTVYCTMFEHCYFFF